VRLGTSPAPDQEGVAILKTNLYEGEIGYIRIGRIAGDFSESLRATCDAFLKSNKASGLVIDLRYAKGDDYAAATRAADLFLREEQPLLDWGSGVAHSTAKTQAIRAPIAVLVNGQTAAAAEALAAMMRQTGSALLLGANTSGQAVISKEFKLLSGASLAIAVAQIKLGDGSPMSVHGVVPDISVDVTPAAQLAWYSDPFAVLSPTTGARLTGTNISRRSRFGEAELLRGRREGLSPDAELTPVPVVEPEKSVLRDPVLARAVDVLKGLALVRQSRS